MRLIICFLLLFAINAVFAQDKRAMTEEEYTDLKYKIRMYSSRNTDSAFVYANQMAESNNSKHLAFANAAISYLLQTQGKAQLSREKYKKALYYLDNVPQSHDKIQLKSYIYNFGGLADWIGKNYGAAIEKFQQGIKLSKQIDDINQIIKFKANIILVNEEVGNHQLAIKNAKELNDFFHENKDLFPMEEILTRKSNLYNSLGSSYEGYFMENQSKRYLLDSAEYFYKKSIAYSKNFILTTIGSKLSLGNIYYWKNDYKNAEKLYYEVVVLAQQNNRKRSVCTAYYNLANINNTIKKYDKALFFYKKSDSISYLTNLNELDHLKSNYHQSIIYGILNQPELAYKHSQIYLEAKEKYETKLNKETSEANRLQGIDNLTKEMISVKRNHEKEVFFNRVLKTFCLILFIVIILLLMKNIRDKNKVNEKVQQFKAEIAKKNYPQTKILEYKKLEKENVTLSIDQAQENDIVEKLLDLENHLEYLNTDFTLIYIAKKIKTNTTYLSYVINKRFEKTFNEYANELKINYAINEMISNEIYRKSSTQVIAESVGFKNADSFAKSFRKRTGVSPAQFANNI